MSISLSVRTYSNVYFVSFCMSLFDGGTTEGFEQKKSLTRAPPQPNSGGASIAWQPARQASCCAAKLPCGSPDPHGNRKSASAAWLEPCKAPSPYLPALLPPQQASKQASKPADRHLKGGLRVQVLAVVWSSPMKATNRMMQSNPINQVNQATERNQST